MVSRASAGLFATFPKPCPVVFRFFGVPDCFFRTFCSLECSDTLSHSVELVKHFFDFPSRFFKILISSQITPFFQLSSGFLAFSVLFWPALLSAQLGYHALSQMSTPIFRFFPTFSQFYTLIRVDYVERFPLSVQKSFSRIICPSTTHIQAKISSKLHNTPCILPPNALW